MSHTFHIPVLGLGYSIDTPLKVARFGVSSVVSIVDDELIERMRKYHTEQANLNFIAINKTEPDYRAKRITAYLNLLNDIIQNQLEDIIQLPFEKGNKLCKYFELLPEHSSLKQGYELMMEYPEGQSKHIFQSILRSKIVAGAVDVNIMAKVDKMNYINNQYTGDDNTDALAAIRGFANSKLSSSVILSAGMNPKLYSYIEKLTDFYPNEDGEIAKKIILKVSDYRSALIQAKFLAKKGLWVSEFRIESGLNCGGHAFATDGFLLGPILEEFKQKRGDMYNELLAMYQNALNTKGVKTPEIKQRITVQGGIGTAEENNFLLEHYGLDATGWGSPFLLVPEVTNVDEHTLDKLAESQEEDFYLSNSSPLGVLFNNFKGSTSENQRLERIEKGRPGSPCTKKYLCTNTEFSAEPICTASREYQNLKIKQLNTLDISRDEYQQQFNSITEKVCLCEGLCASTYIKYNILKPKENTSVAICPGPNLAYFSRKYSFEEMVKHIYGQLNLLEQVNRPHVFVKELNLYVDYLQKSISDQLKNINDKKVKHLNGFKAQLLQGVAYYKQLFNDTIDQSSVKLQSLLNELEESEKKLAELVIG
jgi:hypothetical protein